MVFYDLSLSKVNDPVAARLFHKSGEMPSLVPLEDESIKAMYVGRLDSKVTINKYSSRRCMKRNHLRPHMTNNPNNINYC